MLKNLPNTLHNAITAAHGAKGDKEEARTALTALDLTSLNKDDTPEKIDALIHKAVTKHGHVATICVYPEFVAQAAKALNGTGVGITTVINFPFGAKRTAGTLISGNHATEDATPETTAEDTQKAITDGATDIDIVLDYAAFQDGKESKAIELLRTADEACNTPDGKRVTLKVILETAAFDDYNELHEAALSVARETNAEFLKTSTGKHPNGGATPETAATLMEATATGVKVAGGVSSTDDAALYMTLARDIMGLKEITADRFRIGASGVWDDLIATLNDETSAPKRAKAATPRPSAY